MLRDIWPVFSLSSSEYFWRENVYGGWTTICALLLILICSCFFGKKNILSSPSRFRTSVLQADPSASSSSHPEFRISEIVSDADLKFLLENLDGNLNENQQRWENVIEKRNNLLYYKAKCCKPEDAGPLKYLSVSVFENCCPVILRDFYMDYDYRKKWDKTLVEHQQIQVDRTSGVEIGKSVKKFPLLTPREYVLAWRLWEGEDNTFYCFARECEHSSVRLQKKYVRVKFFRSGWRIRKVAGRNACEIKMIHQEDAGLNVEMAKLAFAKGIWSYVCKMDTALRKYSQINHLNIHSTSSITNAVTLINKVPRGLNGLNDGLISRASSSAESENEGRGSNGEEKKKRLLSRKVVLAKGLLVVGGVICLSCAPSRLGPKVAMAYILTKLRKHRAQGT